MTTIFTTVLNMSINASWLILAVLLLRLLLKKAPKRIIVFLWLLVGIRLICPLSIESAFSIIPNVTTLNTASFNSGESVIDNVANPVVNGTSVSANPTPFSLISVYFVALWLFGIAAFIIYTSLNIAKIKKHTDTAVLLRENIYQSKTVPTPFVFGIFKPKIYLPFGMDEKNMQLVISHEQMHIRHKDHWWKPIGFAVLTLHWFNPLVWVAYLLFCRDTELACDENVIAELTDNERADYSQALLNCSIKKYTITACPVAFGEVSVKERVKSVLNYKKPSIFVVFVAVIVCIAVTVCFLTNPITNLDDDLSMIIDSEIAEHNYCSYDTDKHFIAINHKVLGVEKTLNQSTVYMWAMYSEYSLENGEIKLESGSYVPTAITVKRTHDSEKYAVVEYWIPDDGANYTKTIKEKFPWYLQDKALLPPYVKEQSQYCENAAKEHFKISLTTEKVDASQ